MEGFYELKHTFSIFYCSKSLGNSKLHLCKNALNKRAWDMEALLSQQERIFYTNLTYSNYQLELGDIDLKLAIWVS